MEFKGRIIGILIVLLIYAIRLAYDFKFLTHDFNKVVFFIFFTFLLELLLAYWFGKKYDTYKFLSERDHLSGLYNRRYIFKIFPKLTKNINSNEKINVFILDVNDFKSINDTYGHKTGDYVIESISESLISSMHSTDIIARIGGDEFLIIAPNTEIIPTDKIFQRVEKSMEVISKNIGVDISISIGKSVYPDRAKTLDDLIKLADIKMYKNKSINKNRKK